MTRRYISGWLTFAATIFAVGQALALETLPGEPEVGDKGEAPCDQAVPSDEPLATGRVVAVDRAAGRITLDFRPIPQPFLEGATPIFPPNHPVSPHGLPP